MSLTPADIRVIRDARRAKWLAGVSFGQPQSEYGHKVIAVWMQNGAACMPVRQRHTDEGWAVETYHEKEKSNWLKWKPADKMSHALPLDAAKAIAGRVAHGEGKPATTIAEYTGSKPVKREHPITRLQGECPMAQARARVRAASDPADLFPAGVLTIRPIAADAASNITSEGTPPMSNATTSAPKRSRKPKGDSKEAQLRAAREQSGGTPADEQQSIVPEGTGADAEGNLLPRSQEIADSLAADADSAEGADTDRPDELSEDAAASIRAAVDAALADAPDESAGAEDPAVDAPKTPNAQVWAYVAGAEDPAVDEAHNIESADGTTATTACGQSITLGSAPATNGYNICAYCADGTKKPADAPTDVPLKARGPAPKQYELQTALFESQVVAIIKLLTEEPNAADARAVYDLLTGAVGQVRPLLNRRSQSTGEGTPRVRNASPLKAPIRYTNPAGETSDLTLAQAAKAAAEDYAAPACADYAAKCTTVQLNARLFIKKDLKNGKLDPARVVILDEVAAEAPAA